MTTPNFPTVWYWVVGDTNPTTQVWEGATGAMVANTSANYQSWVANGGRFSGGINQIKILGAANNGAGLIRLTVDSLQDMATGDAWVVQNVGGTTEANGTWLVTIVSSVAPFTFDLQGSTFVHAYTSGGVTDHGTPTLTMANLLSYIDGYNQAVVPPSYLAASSGVDYQMTNTPPSLLDFTPTASGIAIILPQMNLFGSIAKGRQFLVHNSSGTITTALKSFGGTGIAPALTAATFFSVYLTDNSSQAGTVEAFRTVRIIHHAIGDTDSTLSPDGGAITPYATSANLTAARTWTLPAASDLAAGACVLVVDEHGGVTATNTLSVARAGSDTINGGTASIVLNRARDYVLLETDGVSNWTIVGGKGALATTDLSDYAVGTWTPVDASGAGLTFTNVNANYTRIGNLVFIYGRVTYPVTADTTAAKIGGLPFTSANQSYVSSGGASYIASSPGGSVLNLPIVTANATTFIFFDTANAQPTNVQLSGNIVTFVFFYPLT